MNDIMNASDVSIDYSAFDEFASELAPGEPIVTFKNQKWRWRTTDEKTLPPGQTVAANILESERGWLRFEEIKDEDSGKMVNRVVEKQLGKVANRYRPKDRSELGYQDKEKWRKDVEGKPLDPWVSIIQFPAVLVGNKGNYRVMLTGNSIGWQRSVGNLFKEWGGQRALNAGKVPVLALDSQEGRTSHGLRDFPTMTIVEWKSLEEFEISENPDQPKPEPEPAQAEF